MEKNVAGSEPKFGPRPEPWRRYAGLLAESGLDDEAVAQLIDAVGRLALREIPINVFPIGIPWPDGLAARVHLTADNLEMLASVLQEGALASVEVFPLGIPNPEVFQATFNFR